MEVISARREIDEDTGEIYYTLELENGVATMSDSAYAPGDLVYFPSNSGNLSGGASGEYRARKRTYLRQAPAQGNGSAYHVPETADTMEYTVVTGQVFQQVSASVPPSNGSATSEWPTAYRVEKLESAGLAPRASADELNFFRPAGFCDGLLTTVYFNLGSSEISDGDKQWLDQQAAALDCPNSNLTIAGFTDSSGPLDLNIDLSLERARAVAEEFRMRPEGRSKDTAVLAYAEQQQALTTPDGEVEPSNRRAEIYVDFDCTSLDDAEVTLASDENFDMSPPPTPYPQDVYAFKPLRIVYQARGLASEDPETLGRADMLADARLEELSRQVSKAWDVPPGMISSIKIGGKCLAPGDDERVDIDF